MAKVNKTVKTQNHSKPSVTIKSTKSSFMEKYNKANDYVWAMWRQPWLTGLVCAIVLPLTLFAIIVVGSRAHQEVGGERQLLDLVATGLAVILGLAFVLYGAVVCPVLYALRYGKQAAVKAMFFTLLWLALFTMLATCLSLNRSLRDPVDNFNCGFGKRSDTIRRIPPTECQLDDKALFQD